MFMLHVNSGYRVQNKNVIYEYISHLNVYFKSYKTFCINNIILIEGRMGDMQASKFLSLAIKLH